LFSGISCPDRLLPVGPVSLKLVASSYPKPNHYLSAVKNILPQAPLSLAVIPWLHLYYLCADECREGRKASFRAQEKQVPEFYSSSWPYLLFPVVSCEVGLEGVSSEGTAERHCTYLWVPQEWGGCSGEWFVSCWVTHELQEGYE